MPQRLLARLQQSIMGGAAIIAIAGVLSRVLGLVRDRLLSTQFGAGELLDAYFTAFKVPDVIFTILVLGVMSASFVPVFLEYEKKHSKKEALEIANSILNLLFLSLLGLSILAYLFAPFMVGLIAVGDSPQQQETIVLFTRLMLVSLVFFGISNVLAGLLHATKRFFVYALAPILYNVGIILGILLFVPAVGDIGLPLGVVLGAFMHMVVQIPAVMQEGFRWSPKLRLSHPGVRRILQLMPPRAFSLGLTQLNLVILFAVASTLNDGDRSVWVFADNLQHFPINIFGVSLALAAFPVFSEAFADNDISRFKQVFSDNVRRILFFIIPTSIAILLLRAQIVRLTLGAGAFDWNDTILTAQTLGMFSLSLFAQATIPLLARAFFAKQDTVTPVVVSVVAMTINIVGALVLAPVMGVIGLALSFSIAAIIQMLGLLSILRIRHGDLDDAHLINSTWKIIIASIGLGLVIQGVKFAIAPFLDMQTFLGVFIQTVTAMLAGGVVYLFIAIQFHFDEAFELYEKFKQTIQSVWNVVTNAD